MSTDNFKIQIRKGLLEFCILQIISSWGGEGREDLNGDSVIDVTDLLIIMSNWGDCP